MIGGSCTIVGDVFTRRRERLLVWGALASLAIGCVRAEWPMHRGGPRLDGYASMDADAAPQLGWRFSAGKPIKGGAAIARGNVYVGDDAGVFHALSLKDGSEIWSARTQGPIEATPLVFGPLVYVGSADGNLYAFDNENGDVRWVYETGDKIIGGANVADAPDGSGHWILFGSYDSSLHCVDASSGKLVWTCNTDNYINGTPALLPRGEIIFGGCDALLRIVALKDGTQLRQIEADAYVASSVAIAEDGSAYVGHYGNVVLGMDVTNAKVLWTYRDRAFPYLSSAAISGDRLVIGGNDKRVHCIGLADGHGIWQFVTRGKVDASPVICKDTVVVGSQDGRLYGIALLDGAERWMYDIGAPIVASAAASDGWIVVGAEDGALHALKTQKKE